MWSFNTEILLYSILSDAKKGTICVHEHQQTLLFSECFKNCCEIRLRIYVNPPTTHELQEVDIKQTSRKCNSDDYSAVMSPAVTVRDRVQSKLKNPMSHFIYQNDNTVEKNIHVCLQNITTMYLGQKFIYPPNPTAFTVRQPHSKWS